MSVPWLVDIPQTRVAPDGIRRALRELDSTAEVIALSGRRWIVGRVRPTRDSIRIARTMLAQYWQMGQQARSSVRGVARYRFALACLQGFRPVAQYDLSDLDSRVVTDFRVSQWRMRHQSGDLLDQWDREEAQEALERRALLADEHRARETVNYVTRSNFGPAVSSVQSSKPDPVPSGRTRVVSLT